jgi:phosphoribosylaminoimidazole carboxylase
MKQIGIIGDGQLAKMLIEAGMSFYLENFEFYVLPLKPEDDITNSPCYELPVIFVKSYDELFSISDIVTYEFENIDVDYMMSKGYETVPSLKCLKIIQNKLQQKMMYQDNGLNVPETYFSGLGHEIIGFFDKPNTKYKSEYVVKRCQGGYDGKGVHIVYFNEHDWKQQLCEFIDSEATYFIEEDLDSPIEVSVMVAINHETKQEHIYNPSFLSMDCLDNVLNYYFSPIPDIVGIKEYDEQIKEVALKAVKLYGCSGLFAIEMFIIREFNGSHKIYINEISPRPHNTGHHTIDSCNMSQYNALIRILTNKSFEKKQDIVEYPTITYNILGPNFNGKYGINSTKIEELSYSSFRVHMYNKKLNKLGRKMGHITKVFNSEEEMNQFNITQFCSGNNNNIINSWNDLIKPCVVDIVMGSISDMDTVKPCIEILNKLGVCHNVQVLSAHRMPLEMTEYGKHIDESCCKVIIACAGGAAHLPGMVASLTTLPVIGLPVKSSALSGLDSLYSIVQMPRGIPVATVAIGNGVNAGLLACRMLAIYDSEVKEKLKEYMKEMNYNAIQSNNQIKQILKSNVNC